MSLTAVNVSELSGEALDWAVAKIANPEWWDNFPDEMSKPLALRMDDGRDFSPSTDWAQGGPIMDRAPIGITLDKVRGWCGDSFAGHTQYGPTMLVAAMRCYVASNLGDVVEVPECML